MPENMGFPTPPPPQQQDFMAKLMAALGGSQGLINLGGNLLSASGPSPQRVGFGQALGGGLLANQQFQQAQQADALKQMLIASQIQKNKQAQQANRNHVIGNALVDDAGKVIYQGSALDNTFGRVNPGDYTPASLAKFAKSQNWQDLERVWAPVNPVVKDVGGVPTVVQPSRTGAPPTQSPLTTLPNEVDAARQKAEAEKAGQTTGAAVAQAAFDLPRVEQNTNQAIKSLKDLRNHKGLGAITGIYSLAPIVPGTDQAAADALAKQVEGKTFLEAFNTLKGAGQITEVEGTKATAAIGRLSRAQSKADYQSALDDLTTVLETGLDRARKTANKGQPAPAKRSREEILKQYGITPGT